MPLFLLALAVAPPPPPPIVSVAAPVIVQQPGADAPIVIDTIEVEVAGEGRPIWRGSLRVATNMMATFNQNQQQAADFAQPCPGETRVSSRRDQFSIQLSRYRRVNNPDGIHVTASWTRSTRPELCGGYEAPSRTVSLTDMVNLMPGRATQLSGDGGLSITLRLLDRSQRPGD